VSLALDSELHKIKIRSGRHKALTFLIALVAEVVVERNRVVRHPESDLAFAGWG